MSFTDYNKTEDNREEASQSSLNISTFFQSLRTYLRVGVIALLLFIAYTIIFKPVWVINGVKSFLNADYGNEVVSYPPVLAPAQILAKTTTTQLELSEGDLVYLANSMAPQLNLSRVEISPNKIVLFRNLAKSDYPLWLIVDIQRPDSKEKYQIKHLGLGRFAIPQKTIDHFTQKSINLDKIDLSKFNMAIDVLSPSDIWDALNTNQLEFAENKLIVHLDSNTNNTLINKLKIELGKFKPAAQNK